MDRTAVVTDSTITFNLTSRNTSSVPTTLSGTPAAVLYEDGSTTEITGAVTITADLDTKTGLNLFSVDTSTAGVEPGKQYSVVMSAGTVGGTSVVGQVVYEFTMESNAEKSQRLYRSYLYPESTISTVTGNTTTQINFTDIIDAQTPADAIVGRIYSVRDATDGGIEDVVATAFTYPNATVERLSNAGAMSFTVAAGDDVWPVGFVDVEMRGRLTDTRAGYLDDLAAGGANLTEVGGTGDHLTAIPWNAAWDAEVESEVTDAINASTTINDKTGYSLAVSGLDAITLNEPSAVPLWGTVTAREGIAWNVAFNRNKIISSSTEITLRNDADGADIAAAPVTATTSSVTRGEYA